MELDGRLASHSQPVLVRYMSEFTKQDRCV